MGACYRNTYGMIETGDNTQGTSVFWSSKLAGYFGDCAYIIDNDNVYYTIKNMRHSSELVLLMDSMNGPERSSGAGEEFCRVNFRTLGLTTQGGPGLRHNNAANTAFFDGHVASLRASALACMPGYSLANKPSAAFGEGYMIAWAQ